MLLISVNELLILVIIEPGISALSNPELKLDANALPALIKGSVYPVLSLSGILLIGSVIAFVMLGILFSNVVFAAFINDSTVLIFDGFALSNPLA